MRVVVAIIGGLLACAALADESPCPNGFVMPKIRKPHYRGEGAKKPLKLMAAEPLPAFYDARSNGWVTAVKNQGGYGSCWAFGTCGALEGAILKAGLAASVDLSEKNVVNLTGLAGSHGIYGGDVFTPLGYLTRWQGVVQESEDPYPKSGRTVESFGTSPQLLPSYYVRRALILPERTSVADNDFMKRALLKYGALFVNYYSGQEKNGTSCITDSSLWGKANHAVTMIGWDDNFMIGSHKGAFIVKGSWGVSSGDKGFFRIAYDDVTFCTGMGPAVYDGVTDVPFADAVYQYDRIGWQWFESGYTYDLSKNRIKGRGFNRFTASENQEIVAVGLVAPIEDAKYTITIRLSDNNEVLSTKYGVLADMGYYVVDLDVPVGVSAGVRFDVEINMDIPYVVQDDYALACPLAFEAFSDVIEPIYGESYAWDGRRYVRVQDYESGNLIIKAYAKTVRKAKDKFVTEGNRLIPDGTEVVNWYSVYGETASFANTYGAMSGMVCANGRTVLDNWCLGLDPLNAESDVQATISITNGYPCVNVMPKSGRCTYAVEGCRSLKTKDWGTAIFDGTHQFFRIRVTPKQ